MFDTLRATDTLTAAGLEPEHARAIVTTMHDALGEQVATKADIAQLEARIAESETRLTWRLVAVLAGQTAALGVLLRLLG